MRITRRNRIVAFARILGPVGSHAAEVLIGRDLAEQVGQHRGIANAATGDFDRTDLKRFRIYSDMYLAPEPSLGPPCLRALHSPSPSALMPVLSIRRCSGPAEPL